MDPMQNTQDRWNRLELIFRHIRSQTVNYEFPDATLSTALERDSWSNYFSAAFSCQYNVTRDPWNRHRPVATSTQYRQDWPPRREVSHPPVGVHARYPVSIYLTLPAAISETFTLSSPYLVCPVSTPVLLAYELRSTVLTRPGIDDLHVCLCSFDICNLPRLCSECSPSAQSHLKPASIELVFELVYFSGLEGRSY